eukprot:7333917-Ditylum_brightwellii.AAC.1
MAIAIIHHIDPIHLLCSGASKASMKDENAHMAVNSSMMPPLPTVCIAYSKGLAPYGLAPSPTTPAGLFPAGNNISVPVAAPSSMSPFQTMKLQRHHH